MGVAEGVREAVAVSLGRDVPEEAGLGEAANVNVDRAEGKADWDGQEVEEGEPAEERVDRGERVERREAVGLGLSVRSLLPIELVAVPHLVPVGVEQAVESRESVDCSVSVHEGVSVRVARGEGHTVPVAVKA